MKTRRLRLVRPRWTLGTMLLIVGWSSVVVWLNVRPRFTEAILYHHGVHHILFAEYGWPWSYSDEAIDGYFGHWHLAANMAIGLLAVAVLTFTAKYLVRAIVAGLRAIVGKPPPSNGKGPERPSKSV